MTKILKNKSIQKYTPLILTVLIIGIGIITVHSFNQKKIPVINSMKLVDVQYAADFSDDRILMGASHNVFVGKVIEQVGTKERGIGPETQVSVQVIDDIKGDLQGTVTVDQEGGYENGTLYAVGENDDFKSKEQKDGYMLKPGSTYLLATRYSKEQNWYTLNSYPTASKMLDAGTANMSADALKTLAEKDSRVQVLKNAYRNEILLPEDVKSNNTQNSYASMRGNLPSDPGVYPLPARVKEATAPAIPVGDQ